MFAGFDFKFKTSDCPFVLVHVVSFTLQLRFFWVKLLKLLFKKTDLSSKIVSVLYFRNFLLDLLLVGLRIRDIDFVCQLGDLCVFKLSGLVVPLCSLRL